MLRGKVPFAILGTLGFMAIWLTGWTMGVSFIQTMAISGETPFILLFLLTHGGAEFVVTVGLANELKAAAEIPSEPPQVDLRHDGLQARWPNGNGSLLVAVAAGVLALVTHGMLFTSLATAVAGGGLLAYTLGPLLACIWAYTGFQMLRGAAAHLQVRGDVVLDADLDTVTVRRGALVESEHKLPLLGLRVSHDEATNQLCLENDGVSVEVPVASDTETTGLVELLSTMSTRTTAAEERPPPEALTRLREG